MYAAIGELVTPERNVVTLEDPVEIQLPGITQVQVNSRTGLTFARGLRSVLRQDPDVVLVGEARDLETAELALQHGFTGHLVLSTLHTNNAVSALTRLVDMGVPASFVASSLEMVVAQRLVRRPCPDCAAPHRPDAATMAALDLADDDLDEARPVIGTGCTGCSESGYRGRIGVFEVLVTHPDIAGPCWTTPASPRCRWWRPHTGTSPCVGPGSSPQRPAGRPTPRSCGPPRGTPRIQS